MRERGSAASSRLRGNLLITRHAIVHLTNNFGIPWSDSDEEASETSGDDGSPGPSLTTTILPESNPSTDSHDDNDNDNNDNNNDSINTAPPAPSSGHGKTTWPGISRGCRLPLITKGRVASLAAPEAGLSDLARQKPATSMAGASGQHATRPRRNINTTSSSGSRSNTSGSIDVNRSMTSTAGIALLDAAGDSGGCPLAGTSSSSARGPGIRSAARNSVANDAASRRARQKRQKFEEFA